MTFFNQKEEVLDIELTQYGKHLLSIGKFKPAYYQFFDDDIIYNVEYAGETEELQKDIQTRIKESPRPHTQYTFVSSEEDIKKQFQQMRNKKKGSSHDVYVPFSIKHRGLTLPLGKSELGQQKKPAWNIQSRRGKFSDTVTFITGTYSNLKVPRLTLEDVSFKTRIAQDTINGIYVGADTKDTITEAPYRPTSNLNTLSSRFKDNTFIQVEQDYILLDLKEINVDFEQENFDIELYTVELDQYGEEQLTQLYFNKKTENVVNNIYIDTNSENRDFKPNRLEMAETYFVFKTDREIDTQIMCANLTKEEKQNLVATNQMDLDCEDLYETLLDPRINSDVKVEDLGEKC